MVAPRGIGLQRLEAVVRAREQRVAEDQHAYNDVCSPFELKMPYLRLNTISAAFQEVADNPHLLSAMLNVVETRHRSLSGY